MHAKRQSAEKAKRGRSRFYVLKQGVTTPFVLVARPSPCRNANRLIFRGFCCGNSGVTPGIGPGDSALQATSEGCGHSTHQERDFPTGCFRAAAVEVGGERVDPFRLADDGRDSRL